MQENSERNERPKLPVVIKMEHEKQCTVCCTVAVAICSVVSVVRWQWLFVVSLLYGGSGYL